MHITLSNGSTREWRVAKIGVIGPGIVGMPMAAMLADAQLHIGSDQPAHVHVIQRNSTNSGWKVAAINSGRSVIGGIEPDLDRIVAQAVAEGRLSAGHDFSALADADVVLVAIQTDKDGIGPDYGPLMGGLTELARALQQKPAGSLPLIIFESTLAPSSMTTVIRDHFAGFGLLEGHDILLGNSPNRVMPGRLVERVAQSDKLVAGLHPQTPQLIAHLYQHIVKQGKLLTTNSMTAEVVKTLENAYRDVRIAFSAEIAAYCDAHDIDFYATRDQVNRQLEQSDAASSDPNCVPSGGILIPTIGVGGHCLPKDGILFWWRARTALDTRHSLILQSRHINDAAPAAAIQMMRQSLGLASGATVAILGTAYRFNSEDTRNSPAIQLALQLRELGCPVRLHDPYVKAGDQNLLKFAVDSIFSRDLPPVLAGADYLVFATGHQDYLQQLDFFLEQGKNTGIKGVFDGCNLFAAQTFSKAGIPYAGIGRGTKKPAAEFIQFVLASFQTMERGLAHEVAAVGQYLNASYATDAFNRVEFAEVRRLAGSCSTGCAIPALADIPVLPEYQGYSSSLATHAHAAWHSKS